ncbi:MAG TPA: SRPBCC family protein [Acidimicrobiales bacterium]|nr:SRPBCC family protein [Acidimicrobiales bacterium]
MAEHTTQRLTIRATPEQCFEVVTDFERYPDWASDIKDVQIVERDPEGRARTVIFRAAAFGRSTTITLEYDYSDAPRSLTWAQTRGDITNRYDGAYVFEQSGAGDTEVTYTLDVELRVPIPGFVKRRAESRIIGTALRQLKARVEGRGASLTQ